MRPAKRTAPRMQLAHKRIAKRRWEERETSSDDGSLKEEPLYRPNQAMGRTNPWRVCGEGSHDTVAWVARHQVPYLP